MDFLVVLMILNFEFSSFTHKIIIFLNAHCFKKFVESFANVWPRVHSCLVYPKGLSNRKRIIKYLNLGLCNIYHFLNIVNYCMFIIKMMLC
jgi:hypothetical protein